MGYLQVRLLFSLISSIKSWAIQKDRKVKAHQTVKTNWTCFIKSQSDLLRHHLRAKKTLMKNGRKIKRSLNILTIMTGNKGKRLRKMVRSLIFHKLMAIMIIFRIGKWSKSRIWTSEELYSSIAMMKWFILTNFTQMTSIWTEEITRKCRSGFKGQKKREEGYMRNTS